MDKLFFRISVIVVGLLIVLIVIIPAYANRNPDNPWAVAYMCIMGFERHIGLTKIYPDCGITNPIRP